MYLIILESPSVEADLEGLGLGEFGDDEADPPVALVILGVDEVALVVELLQAGRLLYLHACHPIL